MMALEKAHAFEAEGFMEVTVTPEEFKNVSIPGDFGFTFEVNHVIIVRPSFSKSSVFKCFPCTRQRKAGISNPSGLKCVFDKLCLRDGLAWTFV